MAARRRLDRSAARAGSGPALALVALMALPLGWLVALSVSGERGATLAHYRAVLGDAALRKAVWNTVVLAFWVGLGLGRRSARRWPG